ncbi:MAG: metallophosphoesterase family protein [Bacilli bacterium]|nr:metallophosphoesterase family protein [Bacilli bacterium]
MKGGNIINVSRRLSQVLSNSKELIFDDSSKIIIMSDCHRGVGGIGDDFTKNQYIFLVALRYYFNKNYTYIEIGDSDELWENKYLRPIIANNLNIFKLMAKFYKLNRLYMLYGNHDIVKRNKYLRQNVLNGYYDERKGKYIYLFPNINICEGLILRYSETNDKILLVHGHQGDFLNDTAWEVSRMLVRHIWRPLELIGVRNPTSASTSDNKKASIEHKLIDWTRKNQQMLIAGHTHRPMFPRVGEHLYFNDGSCTNYQYITGIEIVNGCIFLIKWGIKPKEDRTLFIDKETLDGPVKLKDYFNSYSLK